MEGVTTITYLERDPTVLSQREGKMSIHYGWVSSQFHFSFKVSFP